MIDKLFCECKTSLPKLEIKMKGLEIKVEGHLTIMGGVW